VSDPIALTEQYVVRADTARLMARAFVNERLRLRRTWIFFGLMYPLMTIFVLWGMDPRFRLVVRVAWALVFAIVPLAILMVGLAVLSYVLTMRAARLRLFEGAVLESGFSADALFFKGPLSESRIPYAAIVSVKRQGDFVFLRQIGINVVSVFPHELFPDDKFAQINRATRK
jgi:hypothetical protein